MKCKTIHSKLIFFLEKDLAPAEMQAVQAHLDSCTDCALFAEEMKKTLSIFETDKVNEINPFFYTRVKAKLENQSLPKLTARPVVVRILQPVVFSIILLLGIYGGIKLGATGSTTTAKNMIGQEELIPYWNELDGEPIESFLME